MATREKVVFRGVAPIPIGHRIKVLHFCQQELSVGLFGGEKLKSQDVEGPRIEDLDSGICYGAFQHHATGGIYPSRVNVESLQILPELKVRSTVIGTVRLCQLTTVGFTGRELHHIETWLEIDVESSSGST